MGKAPYDKELYDHSPVFLLGYGFLSVLELEH